MKKREKTEFLLAVAAYLFLLTLIDIGVIKHLVTSITVKDETYREAGVAQAINPADGQSVYFPIYQKVIK